MKTFFQWFVLERSELIPRYHHRQVPVRCGGFCHYDICVVDSRVLCSTISFSALQLEQSWPMCLQVLGLSLKEDISVIVGSVAGSAVFKWVVALQVSWRVLLSHKFWNTSKLPASY